MIDQCIKILYQRTLTSVTDDPNDYNVLTLNHFIPRKQSVPFTLNDDKIVNRVCW